METNGHIPSIPDGPPRQQHLSSDIAKDLITRAQALRLEGKMAEANDLIMQACACNPTTDPKIAALLVQEQIDKVAKQATKFGSSGRRPGYTSRSSNYPYYKEQYALDVKDIIDKMIETKQAFFIPYTRFPHYSKATIKARVIQGFEFLADHLDTPDKNYAKFREYCRIYSSSTGLCLEHIDPIVNQDNSLASAAMPVGPKENHRKWKDEIDKFIEEAEVGAEYKTVECLLDEEQIAALKMMLDEQNARCRELVIESNPSVTEALIGKTYVYNIKQTKIFIMKRNPFAEIELNS